MIHYVKLLDSFCFLWEHCGMTGWILILIIATSQIGFGGTFEIAEYFQKVKRSNEASNPSCLDPKAADLLHFWFEDGKIKDCVDFASQCLTQLSPESWSARPDLGAVFYWGAVCSKRLPSNSRQTENFFVAATDSRFQETGTYSVAIAEFATLKPSPEQRELLFEKLTISSEGRLILADLVALKTGENDVQKFKHWIEETIDQHPKPLQELIIQNWLYFLVHKKYSYDEALSTAKKYSDKLGSPHFWFLSIYPALFHSRPLEEAREIYQDYLPFARLAFHSRLPIERNTFTYEELYQSVCRDSLLQGSDQKRYQSLLRDWTFKKKDIAKEADDLLSGNEDKADLLTLMGDLSLQRRDFDLARVFFWRAHLSCPYYNRAHEGLRNTDLLLGLPEIDESRLDPVKIEKHRLSRLVENWDGLNLFEKNAAIEKSSFFKDLLLKYLMRASLGSIFFKRSAHRVGDFSKVTRFFYDRLPDTRLLDDLIAVHNVGGNAVVSLTEVLLPRSQSSTNNLSHEITHMLHSSLPPVATACISDAYQQASSSKVFFDPYSSTDEFEYFARGVELYTLGHSDWFKKNDPNLYQILTQLENADSIYAICASK